MPIEQDSDRAVHLFGTGDLVGTPEGDGTIVGIDFLVGEYVDSTQLEPPSILVELKDGRRIHTCMCELDLGSETINEFVGSEFNRLWPPMTDGVPEDAESTIPEGEEDVMMRQAGLAARDKKVIDAFTDQVPADGRILSTDGVRLLRHGLGGDAVAEWVDGKIVEGPEQGTRLSATIWRYLRKVTPSNWFASARVAYVPLTE